MSNETRLLIYADDDPHVRAAIAMALESKGRRVLQCANGLEAIELCRSQPPDILLLDLDMPVLDGYATARLVRAEPELAGTRVIALSGSCDRYAEERIRAAGFDLLLCKPVSLATLLAAIAETA